VALTMPISLEIRTMFPRQVLSAVTSMPTNTYWRCGSPSGRAVGCWRGAALPEPRFALSGRDLTVLKVPGRQRPDRHLPDYLHWARDRTAEDRLALRACCFQPDAAGSIHGLERLLRYGALRLNPPSAPLPTCSFHRDLMCGNDYLQLCAWRLTLLHVVLGRFPLR
jgi:hypothetical protein